MQCPFQVTIRRIAAFGLVLALAWSPDALRAEAPAAPPAAEKSAKPDRPTYTSVMKREDAVTVATLSNGLTVIVQENHVAPVATVRCYVKNTGSAFEGKHLGAGLSHVLEHVVAGGSTTRRPEQEIEKLIDSFGGATNASTSSHLTTYYIDCPARNVPLAVELLADAMQHVKFEPAEFDREMKVVEQELADGEVNRARVTWKLLGQTVYTEHPARHPTIGYLDVLQRTDRQAIIDFYRSRYVPNNQVFVVVGDVDTQAVLDRVADAWTGTPRGPETFVPMPDEPEQLSPREAVREMEGATYDLVLAWPTVPLEHPDLYALDVAAYILAEGESSRMVRRLRIEKQLVLSIGTASYTPHFVRGYFGVMAACRPETFAAAEPEILREIERLRNEPVEAAELARAKKQKAAELIFGQQTVQDAAESLGRNLIATGDPLFDKHYVAEIAKVTAEEVQSVARRYLVPERLNRIVIAPIGGAPKPAAAGQAFVQGEVQAAKLPNGLRVLIKRHANLPMVNMQAFVLAGALVDTPRTAGRSGLVAEMLDKGTPTRSAEEIALYFDSIGGSMSAGAGRATVSAAATVLEEDFAQALAIFADCFTRPSFPEAEFAKVKTLALGAIARRAANPQSEAFEFFYDNLPAASPYHLNMGGKKETVESLDAAALRAYHAQYFAPNNMLVTVFGDVDPAEALKLVGREFGGLKPNPSLAPPEFRRDNAIPQTVARHKQTSKPTGMLLVGYTGPSVFDEKDFAAMTVLDAIVSGYSYPGGWLHNELRGEGLVYGVHAMMMTGPSPGFFAVMAQTQPDTLGEVARRVQANIARAKEGRFTAEDVEAAKQMIVALHAQENTTIGEQAQQAAVFELYGLGYDYEKTFPARIQAVTRDDVLAAARKYLTQFVQATTSSAAAP